MGFGIVPGLLAHYLPSLHFFVTKHVAGVHALNKVLHLGGIGGWHIDLATELLLLVQLMGKLGDVGREVPDNTEVIHCLFLLERGYDAPFLAQVREDGFDGLGVVTHVIVLEFFNVGCVDNFTNNAVYDDGVDRFL